MFTVSGEHHGDSGSEFNSSWRQLAVVTQSDSVVGRVTGPRKELGLPLVVSPGPSPGESRSLSLPVAPRPCYSARLSRSPVGLAGCGIQ